jgi:hypothetical protein
MFQPPVSQQQQKGQQMTIQRQQQSSTNKGGIKVVSGVPTTQSGREKNIVFAQPKHQSAKDWFKRKHDPKNNGKYDADDIALMNRSGVIITHTFEIKRRPDTLSNPNENRKQKTNQT